MINIVDCGEDAEGAMLIAVPIGQKLLIEAVFLTGKTKLVIMISGERHRDEILQPVAFPYLHSVGLNSILQQRLHQQSRVYQGLASEFGSGEDGVACPQG